METVITYFEERGPQNTEKALEIARKRAKELEIRSVLVATTGGSTGAQAAQVFKGFNLIVVTHSAGFNRPDFQELEEEQRDMITAQGGKILTCPHAFGGIGRAVRKKYGTFELDDIIANTLRIFGEGMKVCCEIVLMAADAGLIRTDEDVIAIGGSNRGADTAAVIKPANVQAFFDLRVKEILCKPRL
jgi:hypothetical protein